MKTAKRKLTIRNKGIAFCVIALAFPVAHFLFMFFLQNGGTFILSFQEFSVDSGKFEFIGWKILRRFFVFWVMSTANFPLLFATR